jgi:hypothetical protein
MPIGWKQLPVTSTKPLANSECPSMILMGLIGQACERKLHENNVCTRFIHPSTQEICINLHSTISDGKEMKGSLVGDVTPSEKYESQLGLLFPIYGKIKFMFQSTDKIQ